MAGEEIMKLGPKGEALIKSFETLRLKAYKPTPNDKWTIGWGHTGPEVVAGLEWTEAQAEIALCNDVAWAVKQVICTTDVALSQNQFDALVAFTFNVGVTAEGHSTLIKLVNAGYTGAASAEFMKWNHQGGVVLDGLTRRRAAEKALFLESD
jgi:lysozyme